MNKFLNMDCMEGMKEYPDNYFELSICDPPYGIGISKVKTIGKTKKSNTLTFYKFELDKDYFDAATKRINEFKEQGKLF